MKLWLIFAIIIAAALGIIYFAGVQKQEPLPPRPPQTGTMTISSSAFKHNDLIPKKYTCDGDPPAGGISPPLTISGVPANAKSLALIVDDPDAPGKTWVHWIIWNFPPDISQIPENARHAPDAQWPTEGTTDFGRPGYGGPCPPSGTHRYFFKIYALDTMLNLSSSLKKSDLEAAMQGHILDQAEFVGLYKRS